MTRSVQVFAKSGSAVEENSVEEASEGLSEVLLQERAAALAGDPLGWVREAFPWGEGELKAFAGPQDWQQEVLEGLRDGLLTPEEAIRLAVSSGHGIGKSALVSWIVLWAMTTCTDTKGVVTANTETQLKTKTWSELAKWHRLSRWRSWFKYTATAIFSSRAGHDKTWRIDMVPWSERNTEAFAGLHNQGKRILVVFDEASAIHDLIWEVTEGALTDANTQIIWAVFGNPTRNTGRFFECFHRFRHRWQHRRIDSRSVPITNKRQIKSWAEDHGTDSDFFRVRVRGEFPKTNADQFISSALVEEAARRSCDPDPAAPVVIGVDCARFGDDQSVILTRQGRRVVDIVRLRGKRGPEIARKVLEVSNSARADAIFVDGGGVGASTCDALHAMRVRHFEVAFGGKADNDGDNGYVNKRAEMWGRLRDWLERADIPDDPELLTDLKGPEYSYDSHMRVLLEKKSDMKKRGLSSPDVGDALAVTFAEPVASQQVRALLFDYADAAEDDDWISGG
ncbi:terminase [Kiloniella sp. b19]|uniref:terminase n=1 Tax=Kiloniella sp. GXU_MW_B19 TaxID=3141326 RepID=UPI0031D22969